MNKIVLLAVGLFLFSIPRTQAQDTHSGISGYIKDESGKGIESATVSLYRAKDSALVKMAVTGKQGHFEFDKIPVGKYAIGVTAVGFAKLNGHKIELTAGKSAHKVDDIQLRPASQNLGAVTVTGKRPLIENKMDRTVINVEAAPTNAGASALEVLEKSPGVTVSNDGAISLKGKDGVIIMMDGKQTYLSSTDLANYLRNLPASALDQIEIMPNPPAKYDASGNSGIINIKTKKSRTEGFNGSISLGATVGIYKRDNSWLTPIRTSNSINMNYRKGKVNVFGNYNFNYREGKSDMELVRNFYDKSGELSSTSLSTTEFNFLNNNHTVKLGVDFYANKKNIFGIVLNGFGMFGRPTPYSQQVIVRPDGTVQSGLETNTGNELTFFNYSANFNYKHTFDSTGRELTADLDYVGYNNNTKTVLNSNFYDDKGEPSGLLQLKGEIPGIINIYSAKADYIHPFRNNLRMEAGLKTSFVHNDNEVNYLRNDNGTWVPDSRSNHFIYDENVNAAYVSFNKKWKKWGAQLGLRLENTVAKGYQVTNDSTFHRNYTNLFPTTYINYEASKSHNFNLAYSYRILRPNYQDLNPFLWFLDSLTYRQGNPYLTPQFSHNIELRHTFKGWLTTTLNYSVTEDVIAQLLKQNTEDLITYLTTENVARFQNIGAAINASIKPTKWWSGNIFFNVFNNDYEGIYYNSYTGKNDPISIAYTSFLVNVTNTFTFKKGWTGELSGWYRGKSIEQLTVSEPMYFMALGVQKTIMKTKGTLRLNVRDPFHWQQFRGHTRYSDIDVKIQNRWDNRNITFNFSYRFGKTTVAQARRRNSGTNDEQNRAGGQQQ